MKKSRPQSASSAATLATLQDRAPPDRHAHVPADAAHGVPLQPLVRPPRPKKSWGQHFLRDQSVLADIVGNLDGSTSGTVLELGAGLGALTEPLLRAGLSVIAIERDRDLLPHLEVMATRYPGKLMVEAADVQALDYAAFAARTGGPLHVFGNLPYQLSSRILVALAEAGNAVRRATVLVQKEVGERLVAGPPGRTYGLLSVLVQRRFGCRLGRAVPPGAFFPPPKVHSVVVELVAKSELAWRGEGARARDAAAAVSKAADAELAVPNEAARPSLAEQEEAWLVAAARAAFGARRKTLRNSLMGGLGRGSEDILAAIHAAHVEPGARAETLTLEQMAALGRALFARSF